MAKQLHVNLSFSADTEKVRSQLKGLQKDIESLMGNPKYANESGFTKEIQKASVAAATLKNQLYEATNFRTGKLDLGHFNRSLKESGYTLRDYRLALESLGPSGQVVFGNLAKSIITAEVPVKRLSTLVTQFGTTLKNAARWQISSGLLHGLAGTMQSAVGYAKDLNSSLNSIQIVTGNSASQMAEFAAQANRSAKALSTTTNEYAKASLIFAQQGLNGSEITARTDTVIKMANVTGESADAVSSYMTAIWNNFAKGSENLEHYADVITALGASTASSSEEIANGLSKFASVADTIGLSYDYATSMLAALVANTRQSADIVGTSLRTILARLQSVKLGETLEDGVELTKYTEALNTIGVKVLDLNGELKSADTILEDVASRWDNLTKAQKAAVSQTVAGTRQYSQFIAIMESWGDVQKNLRTAARADGALQSQADIFEESWEAASNRVRASLEAVFSDLIKDKLFINFMNGFSKVLDILDDFIDGLGGLQGVLLAISSIFLNNFKSNAIDAVSSVKASFESFTGKERDEGEILKAEAVKQVKASYIDEITDSGNITAQNYGNLADAQNIYLKATRDMSEEQKIIARLLMEQHSTLIDNANASAKQLSVLEDQAKVLEESYMREGGNPLIDFKHAANAEKVFDSLLDKDKAKNMMGTGSYATKLRAEFKRQMDAFMTSFSEDLENLFGTQLAQEFRDFARAVKTSNSSTDFTEMQENMTGLIGQLSAKAADAMGAQNNPDNARAGYAATAEDRRVVLEYSKALAEAMGNTVKTTAATEGLKNALNSIPQTGDKASRNFVEMAGRLSSFGLVLSNMRGIFSQLKGAAEGTIPVTSALISVITSLGFTLSSWRRLTAGLTMEVIANKAAMVLSAIGVEGYAAAITSAATAQKAFQLSLGPIAIALAAITAAVVLAVRAYKDMEANSPENALKRAEAASDEATAAYERIAKSVDEVKDKLKSLGGEYDTLKTLTEGTREWYDAIVKINDQVTDLLKKYPELAGYLDNTKGYLELSEEGQEYLKDAATRDSQEASVRAQIAEYNKGEAQKQLNLDNTDGKFGYNRGPWNAELGKYEEAIYNAPGSNEPEQVVQVLQKAYDDPRVKQMLFKSQDAAEKVANLLYGTLEDSISKYGAEFGTKKHEEDVAYVQSFIDSKAVQDTLKKNGDITEANEKLANTIILSNAKLEGTLRDTSEVLDLFNNKSLSDIRDKAKAEVENKLNSTATANEVYQEYARAQGNITSVGNGKFVDDNNKKVKVSQKEIVDALADGKYLSEELSKVLEESLRESLSNIKHIDTDKLQLEDLVKIDNLKNQFSKSFGSIGEDSIDETIGKFAQRGVLTEIADNLTYVNQAGGESARVVANLTKEFAAGHVTIKEYASA